jgi:Predicted exporters of the RND superfamily
MIADDMMTFIKSDIVVFGLGVLLFIIATLWFVFRKLIWIIVPISSCFFSVIIMTGLLGLLGWKVTVISSNFIALMLILTMAMNIHMSTRFLQIKEIHPNKKIEELVTLTTNKMFWPILYTALTTIIAFLSLIFSEIKPIIDFGWMMTLGLITSFIITFTLLPSLINFVPKEKILLKRQEDSKITSFFAQISLNNHKTIFTLTIAVIILSLIGISRLEVETVF